MDDFALFEVPSKDISGGRLSKWLGEGMVGRGLQRVVLESSDRSGHSLLHLGRGQFLILNIVALLPMVSQHLRSAR